MNLRFVPIFAPAYAALRQRARAGLLISLLGAGALGMVLAGSWLTRSNSAAGVSIALPAIPAAGPALQWTTEAKSPATTQAESLAELLELLSVLTWVGFGVASLSIFSCCAVQARERSAELSVRRAVGASLRQSVISLLLESSVLAVLALVAGLALGAFLLSLARAWWPGLLHELGSAGPVPALTLSAVLAAAGLAPLWLMRARHLVEPGHREIGLKTPTIQVAVSIALLLAAAALLSGRSLDRSTRAREPEEGMLFAVDSGLESPAQRARVYAGILERVSRQTSVSAVSLSSAGALLGLGTTNEVTSDCGQCVSGTIILRFPHFTAVAHAVSADSFHALNLRVADGRVFSATDSIGAEPVAVVNRQLARRYFQAGAAVGRNIYLGRGWPTRPYRVIGIVEDSRSPAIGGPLQPREAVYVSVLQHPPRRIELLVRSQPGVLSDGLPSAIRSAAGIQASVAPPARVADVLGAQIRAVAWFGGSFGITAALMLGMGLVGTLYTMLLWAEAMAWEVALRRALGARKLRMAALVLLRAGSVAGGGMALGVFLYGSVLTGALSTAVTRLPLVAPGLLLVTLFPGLLALLAGATAGLRVLRRPPAEFL